MTTITPPTGSIGVAGKSVGSRPNVPRNPGYAAVALMGNRARVVVDQKSINAVLPSLLATFTERRRLIRSTTDQVRDVVYNINDAEITIALELDGEVFDAALITGIEMTYRKDGGAIVGTISDAGNPEVFSLARRAVVRGEVVNVLTIILAPAVFSAFFTLGKWTLELFLADGLHQGGCSWGVFEIEIRSPYEQAVITVPAGALSFSTVGSAPTVIYRVITTMSGSVELAGYVPIVTQQFKIQPAAGSVALATSAPMTPGRMAPAAGQLSVTGSAPVIS